MTYKRMPSAIEIDASSRIIMDGATVSGGISSGGVHVVCPKCGSTKLHTRRLTIRGNVPQPGSDIECLVCGHREAT